MIKQFLQIYLLYYWVVIATSTTCPTGSSLIPNCATCITNNNFIVCNTCLNGYFLASTNTCRQCSLDLTNCAFCTINGNIPSCSICNSNYGILNNQCQTCTNITGCQACQIFNNYLKCNKCKSGLVLYQSQTICVTCQVPNCQTCSININGISICSGCLSSYYLSNNNCQACSIAIQYCMSCQTDQNSKLICTSCASSRLYLSDNACIPDCSAGGLLSCSSCEIVDISTNFMRCLSCQSNFYLELGTRLCKNCSQVLIGCNSCIANNTNSSNLIPVCNICDTGYYLSSTSNQCILCSSVLQNCSKCQFNKASGKSQCNQCASGYIINTTANSCSQCSIFLTNLPLNSCKKCNLISSQAVCLECTDNYIFSNGNCLKCDIFIANCLKCAGTSTLFSCSTCVTGYLLNSSGQCQLCSSLISNCYSCNQVECTDCLSNYYTLDNKNCLANCLVQNCIQCVQKNNKRCTRCFNGYTLNAFQCQLNKCTSPLIFNGLECACPFYTYYLPQSNACLPCSDPNCLLCPGNVCKQCQRTYFAIISNTTSCVKCMNNCLFCQKIDHCNLCVDGYYFLNGACMLNSNGITEQIGILSSNNVYGFCIIGCRVCQSVISCQTCQMGYYLNNSKCFSCPINCKSCKFQNTILNNTIIKSQISCLICYQGMALINTKCLSCNDINCIDCKYNTFYCILCAVGYAPDSLGNCKPCATNCDSCDILGPGKCDLNKCILGYSRWSNQICIKCLNKCASCQSTFPFTCLGCSNGAYLINSSNVLSCVNCPLQCHSCNNSLLCTSCKAFYTLSNGKCISNCELPCLRCTFGIENNQVCTLCIQGYIIQRGLCQPDLSCLVQKNCQFCSLNSFSYKGDCFKCMQNCRKCQFNPNDPAFIISNNNYLAFLNCTVCTKGYYLEGTDCKICRSQCTICLSLNECHQCKSGYFLQQKSLNSSIQIVGICRSCHKNCANCLTNPNRCTSCNSGFVLSNFNCIALNNIAFNIVLSSGTNHNTTFSNLVNQMNDIFLSICDLLGPSFRSNTYLVFIQSIANGSIILAGNAGIDNQTNNPSSVYNQASNNLKNAKLLNSYSITSSELSPEGFNPQSPAVNTTTANNFWIYIIIGSIVLVILLVIMIVCCYKYKKKKQQQEDTTTKRTSQAQNEPTTSKNMIKNMHLSTQQKISFAASRQKSGLPRQISHISDTQSQQHQHYKQSSRPKESLQRSKNKSRRQVSYMNQKSGMIPKRSNYTKQMDSAISPQKKKQRKSKQKSRDPHQQLNTTLKRNKKNETDYSELKYRKKRKNEKKDSENDQKDKTIQDQDPVNRRYIPNSNTQYI